MAEAKLRPCGARQKKNNKWREDESHYECLYPLEEEESLSGKFKSNKDCLKCSRASFARLQTCALYPIMLFSYYTNSTSFMIIIIFIPQQIRVIFSPLQSRKDLPTLFRALSFSQQFSNGVNNFQLRAPVELPLCFFIARHFMIIFNT